MTLITALKSDAGIVLAGDKRAHTGSPDLAYNDNATKVFKLNEKVAIGGAGDGFDAQLVIDELLKAKNIESIDVDEISKLAYEIATQKQMKLLDGDNGYLFKHGFKSPPQFGFLIVGYTKSGKAKIYSIMQTNLTPREVRENHCQIGMTLLADYILSKKYKKDMSVRDLEKLAVTAIKETSKFITAVGSTHDVITIQNSSA